MVAMDLDDGLANGREAMQHLATIVGHDGLCMTHSTTYVLAVAP
jgi:glycerol-3-phosphate responsive antiterminator